MPNTLQKVLEQAGRFVTAQQGRWEHGDWEAALSAVAKLGFAMNDETKRNFGNLLEGAKYFYHAMPAKPAKKTGSPRK